ncbi:MAG TPA: ribonucleotide reductase N-terminal alpha domain-containing protein, partial [Bacteroidales bacterium]|nr:ribonucleotide reductase N-terminal alpha domain-containing protein [Bacteroidales bacterium]
MYKASDVEKAATEYFNGDTLAANVWKDKYALKKDETYFELTPKDMYKRISEEFTRIENKYKNPLDKDETYNLLVKQVIIPGGSILYGVGNKYSFSSLGNCFVIGNGADSYGGICSVDQEQVQLMKRRAGVGHDLSHLRAKGTPTTNSAKTSSGIVPFMERYSNSTREVAQDGRRGALMLSIDISHPEAESFITAKDDLTKVTGANISVKVDDEFMDHVSKNQRYLPIWRKLVHQAWKSAEPGLLF